MDRESPAPETEQQHPPQHVQQPPAASTQPGGPQTVAAAPGKDALGRKEKLLAPFYNDMAQIAQQLAPQFKPLGLNFRPEILLATAMQEADDKDPVGNRSFDNGLGIMQITPYKGKNDPVPMIDEPIASAIGWDNTKDVEYNVKHSHWRNAHANIMAGGLELLGKAKAIKGGVPQVWAQMDEQHRWRATLYAYNAGQGAAIKALKKGGPNARMISTFTYKGVEHSHDYTAETDAKLGYVDQHDVFAGGEHHEQAAPAPTTSSGATPTVQRPPAAAQQHAPQAAPQAAPAPQHAASATAPATATASGTPAVHPQTAAPAPAAPVAEHASGSSSLGAATMPAAPASASVNMAHIAPSQSKEQLLAPYYKDMQDVAQTLAPQFVPVNLQFKPEILLAISMHEADPKNPATTKAYDNGLGLTQITPFHDPKDGKYKFNADVAKAIHWDNDQALEYNLEHSSWRDAKANLTAGALVVLGTAKAIKQGVSNIWTEMDEPHRWRAVFAGYAAGAGFSINRLKQHGPQADLTTVTHVAAKTDKSGKVVPAHDYARDYSAEFPEYVGFVDKHDPFAAGGGAPSADPHAAPQQAATHPAPAQDAARTQPAPAAPQQGAPVVADAAHTQPAPAPAPGQRPAPATADAAHAQPTPQQAGPAAAPGVVNMTPGGHDALGRKENMLAPFFNDMQAVANEVAPKFLPYGLHFRPEILLATALQEAANKDPLTNRSFDNGLGIMQITPSRAGKLDEGVARLIHWNNDAPLEQNIANSNWRNARANIEAGAEIMLGKTKSIFAGAHDIWNQMDEPHRWRAVLYAYNAGQGAAIKCLKAGGPNASMISTFTNKQGQVVSHDYTAEISEKLAYTDSHDAFSGEASPTAAAAAHQTGADQGQPGTDGQRRQQDFLGGQINSITSTVGKGGNNRKADVLAVQKRLLARGVEPGGLDGIVGPHTITAIEAFQATIMAHPDGMIEPGHETAQHLFHENGTIDVSKRVKPAAEPEHAGGTVPSKDPAGTAPEHAAAPTRSEHQQTADNNVDALYDSLSKSGFSQAISGSTLTWHDALFLPSWGRHAKPSDFSNTSDFNAVMQNIPRQAAALQKVSDHFGGKTIHVHCWVRPPAYNKQIGGASHSAHLRGTATDFHFEGMSADAVRKVLRADPSIYPGAGELGVSWVHLDIEHKAWFQP